jgi:hypothetical protein
MVREKTIIFHPVIFPPPLNPLPPGRGNMIFYETVNNKPSLSEV